MATSSQNLSASVHSVPPKCKSGFGTGFAFSETDTDSCAGRNAVSMPQAKSMYPAQHAECSACLKRKGELLAMHASLLSAICKLAGQRPPPANIWHQALSPKVEARPSLTSGPARRHSRPRHKLRFLAVPERECRARSSLPAHGSHNHGAAQLQNCRRAYRRSATPSQMRHGPPSSCTSGRLRRCLPAASSLQPKPLNGLNLSFRVAMRMLE